jgi:hypothetical protein
MPSDATGTQQQQQHMELLSPSAALKAVFADDRRPTLITVVMMM